MTARCVLTADCLLIRPQNLPELQRVDVAEHQRAWLLSKMGKAKMGKAKMGR
jgi:hypothetical protein